MIKISRYGQAVGVWTLDVAGYNKEIKLKVGDGRNFLKIISKAGDNKDLLFDKFNDFIYEIIKRNDAPQNSTEDEELKLYIDNNLLNLLNETMVVFRLTTREDLEKQKKNMITSGE